jgi:hypothetical protein
MEVDVSPTWVRALLSPLCMPYGVDAYLGSWLKWGGVVSVGLAWVLVIE